MPIPLHPEASARPGVAMKPFLLVVILIVAIQLICVIDTRANESEGGLPDFNKLWNYSNPGETRDKFTALVAKAEKSPDRSYLLQLKTQIARTYGLQANFDAAHKILDQVETELNDQIDLVHVRYFLERGRAYNSANKKNKARDLFIKAYESGKAIGADSYSIDGAHMIAIAATTLEEKLVWNNKGLEESRRSSDKNVKRWIGVFHNNMGWDLFEVQRYDEALRQFSQCQDFYESVKNEERLGIARWSYAKTLRFLGRIDESLSIQLDLLKTRDGKDPSGYGFEELGELYLLKGNIDVARGYFERAYKVLSKDIWLQKNEKSRLDRLKKLSGGGQAEQI